MSRARRTRWTYWTMQMFLFAVGQLILLINVIAYALSYRRDKRRASLIKRRHWWGCVQFRRNPTRRTDRGPQRASHSEPPSHVRRRRRRNPSRVAPPELSTRDDQSSNGVRPGRISRERRTMLPVLVRSMIRVYTAISDRVANNASHWSRL